MGSLKKNWNNKKNDEKWELEKKTVCVVLV
jgi:hypothetical protein